MYTMTEPKSSDRFIFYEIKRFSKQNKKTEQKYSKNALIISMPLVNQRENCCIELSKVIICLHMCISEGPNSSR